jgi:hypothetical protein
MIYITMDLDSMVWILVFPMKVWNMWSFAYMWYRIVQYWVKPVFHALGKFTWWKTGLKQQCTQMSIDWDLRGGPLEKWWGGGGGGGGGGGKSKNKNRAGKTNQKNNSCTRNVWKKKFVQRLFNRENYKLVCILYIYNILYQCKIRFIPQPLHVT